MFRPRALPVLAAFVLAALASWSMRWTPRAAGAHGDTAPPESLRQNTPTHWAVTNARIVLSASRTIDRGTLVFRDGVITQVGPDVAPPPDARVLDFAGKTLYPGFVDPYSETGGGGASPATATARGAASAAAVATPTGGARHWNSHVTPEERVDRSYRPDADLNRRLRAQGVVARLVAPARGVIKGVSAVVNTSDEPPGESIVRDRVAQHVTFVPPRGAGRGESDDRYPSSPMGALSLARQVFYDAKWYRQAFAASTRNPQIPHPVRNAALEALAEQLDDRLPFIIDSADELYALRAGRFAEEFGIPVIVRGSGQEFRRISEIAAMKLPLLVPVNFPRAPNVASPEYAVNVSLEELMNWDLAPENPAALETAGVLFALTGHGLRDRADYLKNIRKAVARGLSKETALRAMTQTPARLLGVERCLGTLEPGKCASFVVTDGDLFEEKTRVLETWVDGRRFEISARPTVDARGKWWLSVTEGPSMELSVEGEPARLSAKLRPGGVDTATTSPATGPATTTRSTPQTLDAANVTQQDARLSFTFKHDTLGQDGIAMFSAVFGDDEGVGQLVLPDGTARAVTLERTAPPSTQPPGDRRGGGRRTGGSADAGDESATRPATQPAKASFAVNFPFGDFGRDSPTPDQPRVVHFVNATVWTAGPQGTLQKAHVTVENGKIARISTGDWPGGAATEGTVVVDCQGKHLAPGIIDCHSHMATDGGVNEGGQNITAETRIGDFIDPDDINLYRQLASGVTSANILHGSANAIGGQNQVIKLRWGANPEDLKFAGAPAGIKFALGENPRGANFARPFDDPRPPRYPQTRMGVDQLIRNAFAAARDYRAAQKRHAEDPRNHPPVRTDLELEAVAEILEGKRWIHCHSYRQDEILAFIRACEDFGVTIGSLQHILEGYKVADAIARHGATASCFSDWWAFKLEVYDAIPYAGALMHDAGVVVSFNSDDAEMARRLHSEAAKATKYGGVPPGEAIKFITLNPAKQLRIEDRVGSIEVGKDADLAVWSAPPMSMFAVCEQTWIDGRKYFDRQEDRALRARDAERRQALIQKILASGEAMSAEDDSAPPRERDLWPKEDLYCGHGEHDHHE